MTSQSAWLNATAPGKLLRERAAELAARARDYDALWSRSDRIGDVVLQRSATRGSFHGN